MAPHRRRALGAEHGAGGGAVLLCGSAGNSCRGNRARGEWEAGCRRVQGGREGHPVAVAKPWFESWSQAGYISVVHFSETLLCGTSYECLTRTVKHAQLRSQWAPLLGLCPARVTMLRTLLGLLESTDHSVS